MAGGLYGKLVAKRDFIAVDLPSGFLQKWEPWLQGAVTGANLKLGGNWQRIFFTAPIWRFWLGREVLGFPAMGVLMPSVDGVGRQFPLCLIVSAPTGRVFKPLFQDPQGAWFDEAEDFLLSTLDEGVPFELTLQRLKTLREPDSVFAPDLPEGVAMIPGGLIALTPDPSQIDMPLRLVQYARLMRDEPGLSFWWTIGGDGYPPTSFAVNGLPDSAIFLRMLQSPVAPIEVPPPPPPAPIAQAGTTAPPPGIVSAIPAAAVSAAGTAGETIAAPVASALSAPDTAQAIAAEGTARLAADDAETAAETDEALTGPALTLALAQVAPVADEGAAPGSSAEDNELVVEPTAEGGLLAQKPVAPPIHAIQATNPAPVPGAINAIKTP